MSRRTRGSKYVIKRIIKEELILIQATTKFMGLVEKYKKGEIPGVVVEEFFQINDEKSVKIKTKHDDLPKKVTEEKISRKLIMNSDHFKKKKKKKFWIFWVKLPNE